MIGPYVVVTPARNEADHIGRTVASMLQQTVRPQRWVIVDDGSSDDTAGVVGRAAEGDHVELSVPFERPGVVEHQPAGPRRGPPSLIACQRQHLQPQQQCGQ